MWDKNYNKKPAYTSIASLLQSAASAGLRSPPTTTAVATSVGANGIMTAAALATATAVAK